MAKNVIINGVTYNSVPEVDIPISDGGTAKFFDTSDATLDGAGKMLEGVTAYANGVKYTGSIVSKAAATYMPNTADQTIAASQYLSGAQTIKGDANLQSQNILSGVSIFGVNGSITVPNISQDQTTKVLTIS